MSTFDGHVAEFPSIRIDRFRKSHEDEIPPLAYFLSHVHTDHLVGLDSSRKVFIYCSPATREILLRLEKYPHRMNFARGILEVRKQTYRRLAPLVKAIPLHTPTVLELSPGNSLRVTLFDANHCIGAVMFLIQGQGKAILYTGDIRSEPWWVDSLSRNPLLLPYIHVPGRGSAKDLDNLYLDTTYIDRGRHDAHDKFATRQEGLSELLSKVSEYPADTTFYLDAWTFGYEEVWQVLSNYLDTRVHLDNYRLGLYTSLVNGTEPKAQDCHQYCGYLCGNHMQKGILTREQSRLHSCERGAGCPVFEQDHVRITPIVSRHRGVEMAELGTGGGLGDLDQHVELDLATAGIAYQLIGYCVSKLKDQPELQAVVTMLQQMLENKTSSIPLDGTEIARKVLHGVDGTTSAERVNETEKQQTLLDLPLDRLIPTLVDLSRGGMQKRPEAFSTLDRQVLRSDGLPTRISFPYARHSSYSELCLLVGALKPREITPCTVSSTDWNMDRSMHRLFGHLYDRATTFKHDETMKQRIQSPALGASTPEVAPYHSSPSSSILSKRKRSVSSASDGRQEPNRASRPSRAPVELAESSTVPGSSALDRSGKDRTERALHDSNSTNISRGIGTAPSTRFSARQAEAFNAAGGHGGATWFDVRLTSTSNGANIKEAEL